MDDVVTLIGDWERSLSQHQSLQAQLDDAPFEKLQSFQRTMDDLRAEMLASEILVRETPPDGLNGAIVKVAFGMQIWTDQLHGLGENGGATYQFLSRAIAELSQFAMALVS